MTRDKDSDRLKQTNNNDRESRQSNLYLQCPSLIKQMVHGGPPGEGTNEALNLLLKRPWSTVVSLAPMDKQVNNIKYCLIT